MVKIDGMSRLHGVASAAGTQRTPMQSTNPARSGQSTVPATAVGWNRSPL
ncbi:hypothetical protein [Luteimonas mephitis]|nr:hypothetical protein [Luteimonas mephitis]